VKDTYLVDNYSINCKGNLIDLSSPKVMSIINTTPDSFYDGGQNNSIDKALSKIENDLKLGATFIDIGGYSSKPNASEVSEKEEINRTISYIEQILKRFPETIISIDTFRARVASLAIESGAAMINDISAFSFDNQMLNTIIKYNVPYVLMHMQGEPRNMQNNPSYENIVKEVMWFLAEKIRILINNGVKDIIIDPGFGFGKSVSHNYTLMSNLKIFRELKQPILVGISRKSMISKLLKISSLKSINGTTALNMYAISNGTKILRVHDVKQAMECITIHNAITKNK
jgi:dihydropteroate synthase